MFEKNMRIAYLLDFYIDVLDEHTASIMRAYYEDDLSLAEIAKGESISRQGIRHVIKKAEEQLEFLESKLALAKRYSAFEDAIGTLSDLKTRVANEDKKRLEAVISILEKGV